MSRRRAFKQQSMLVEISKAKKQASELMELDHCKAIRLLLC